MSDVVNVDSVFTRRDARTIHVSKKKIIEWDTRLKYIKNIYVLKDTVRQKYLKISLHRNLHALHQGFPHKSKQEKYGFKLN